MKPIRFTSDAADKVREFWNEIMDYRTGFTRGDFYERNFGVYLDDVLRYIRYPEQYTVIPDLFSEIFSSLNVIEVGDVYKINADMLNSKIDKLPKDLRFILGGSPFCEVASGIIAPSAMSNELGKMTSGSITLMDPLMGVTFPYDSSKFILKPEEFRVEDGKNYAMLAGIYTCDATLEMIKSAYINGTGLYIAMCGCTHFNDLGYQSFYYPYELWLNYIYDICDYYNEIYANGKRPIEKFSINELYPTICTVGGNESTPILYLPPTEEQCYASQMPKQ